MKRKFRCYRVDRLWFVWVVAGLALIVGGCVPTSADESTAKPAVATDGVFKLGVLGPFTGPAASVGAEFKRAATMAFDAIDWKIGDYQIEPIWIDSQSDPEKAVKAYEQAIIEGSIQAAILNWHSSVAVECMDVAAKYEIPHIFPFGATEAVNEKFHTDVEKYSYWMNKGWPAPEKLSVAYVEVVEDAIARGVWSPKNKTVAICGENTDWGRSFGGAMRQQLKARGWTTVAEEYFDLDQVLFYPLLNEFKAKDVALIAVTNTSPPAFAALINQADEIGIKSLIIADGLGWGGEWYEMTGASSNYVLDQIPGWLGRKGKEFAAAFEARWGTTPSPSAAGLAFDGTNMFIQIAQHTLAEYGELSSETVYLWAKENLQKGKWSYTDGVVMQAYKYTFETMPDPVVGEGYYMFPVRQYFDGVGKIVYPPQPAEQELQFKP